MSTTLLPLKAVRPILLIYSHLRRLATHQSHPSTSLASDSNTLITSPPLKMSTGERSPSRSRGRDLVRCASCHLRVRPSLINALRHSSHTALYRPWRQRKHSFSFQGPCSYYCWSRGLFQHLRQGTHPCGRSQRGMLCPLSLMQALRI